MNSTSQHVIPRIMASRAMNSLIEEWFQYSNMGISFSKNDEKLLKAVQDGDADKVSKYLAKGAKPPNQMPRAWTAPLPLCLHLERA